MIIMKKENHNDVSEEKKMHPTPEQFETIKLTLQTPYESVYLKCDGYRVQARVTQRKMRLIIIVYVNDFIKGSDIFIGNESDLDKRTDIAKRFYRVSYSPLSKATKAANDRLIKAFGKEGAKQRGYLNRIAIANPEFNSAQSFIDTLTENNADIQLLTYDEYCTEAKKCTPTS